MKEQNSYLITGANSFLGKAFARKLSENLNNRVFLTSRAQIEFDEKGVLDEILANGNVRYLPNIDLTVEEDINLLCNELDCFSPEKFHVINCLGFFAKHETIDRMNICTARSIFDGNILSLYAVAHKIIPLMCSRGGGHFIGFSTHTSYQSYPLMAAFTAAKVAVESLIKGISNEYLSEGIIANVVAPATLKTKVEIDMKPNGDHENWLELSEVCNLVESLILCSNNIVNGTIIQAYKYSDSYFKQAYYDRINAKGKQ